MFCSPFDDRRGLRNRLERPSIAPAALLVLAAMIGLPGLLGKALAEKGGNGNGGGQAERIPLCVTFDDLLGDRIQSDWWPNEVLPGDNPYCDSESGVTAGSIGGFAMDTAPPKKPSPSRWSSKRSITVGGRMVWLDFTDPVVAGTVDTPFASDGGAGTAEVLMFLDDVPDGTLSSMSPGEFLFFDMQLLVAPTEQALDWRVTFGKWPGGRFSPTDQVKVTALDEDGDSLTDAWRIETTGNHVGRLAKYNDTQNWDDRGEFYLPCGLTLTVDNP